MHHAAIRQRASVLEEGPVAPGVVYQKFIYVLTCATQPAKRGLAVHPAPFAKSEACPRFASGKFVYDFSSKHRYGPSTQVMNRPNENRMAKQIELGGSFTLPGTSLNVNRMGYGAMQLAGPQVWGPPRDVDAAIAVLREAVAAGVNHIDTSDF
jgi:hypothetical protein